MSLLRGLRPSTRASQAPLVSEEESPGSFGARVWGFYSVYSGLAEATTGPKDSRACVPAGRCWDRGAGGRARERTAFRLPPPARRRLPGLPVPPRT